MRCVAGKRPSPIHVVVQSRRRSICWRRLIGAEGDMTIAQMIAAAGALAAGLAFAGGAQAQDFNRDFDQLRSDRSEGDSVQLRWSTSLGGSRHDSDAGPRLALRLSQNAGTGDVRNLDVVSYSFTGEGDRLRTPFRLNADGDGEGGWLSTTMGKVLLGAGVGLVIWGVVEATDDDDGDQPSGPV
jgi:hypothetical protein